MSRELEIERRARLRSALVSAAREEEPSSSFLASLSAIAAPEARGESSGGVGTAETRLETASATGTTSAGAFATGWKLFAVLLAVGAVGAGVALFEQREPPSIARPATTTAPPGEEPAIVAAAPAPPLPAPAPAEMASISVADLPSVKSPPAARALAKTSTPTAAPAPPAARLAEETRAVAAVRAAIHAGNTAEALRLLDAYHAEFPSGILEEEARILHIESLAMAGDRSEAARRAARFLAERPSSHYAPRVRALESRLSAPE